MGGARPPDKRIAPPVPTEHEGQLEYPRADSRGHDRFLRPCASTRNRHCAADNDQPEAGRQQGGGGVLEKGAQIVHTGTQAKQKEGAGAGGIGSRDNEDHRRKRKSLRDRGADQYNGQPNHVTHLRKPLAAQRPHRLKGDTRERGQHVDGEAHRQYGKQRDGVRPFRTKHDKDKFRCGQGHAYAGGKDDLDGRIGHPMHRLPEHLIVIPAAGQHREKNFGDPVVKMVGR